MRFDPDEIDAWIDTNRVPCAGAATATTSPSCAEFSLTQVLDQPVVGRVFFEEVIREDRDLRRPDRVGLVFDRRVVTRGPRPTPGSSAPGSSLRG